MQQLQDLSIYILAIRVADVVDILLVASLVYALLYVVRGTRAIQLLRGILILVLVVFLITQLLRLTAFEQVITALLPAIWISIPIIFQPELRRAFERLGRAGMFVGRSPDASAVQGLVEVIVQSARSLSEAHYGALIVIERQTDLEDWVERGLALNAVLTPELLTQIFQPNTPLHDGAVILRGDRLAAARVVLPLSDSPPEDPTLGTRHLAALSITEISDALVVVVSEETGIISLANEGQLTRCLDELELAQLLYRHLVVAPDAAQRRFLGLPGLARWWRELRDAPAAERQSPAADRSTPTTDRSSNAPDRSPQSTDRRSADSRIPESRLPDTRVAAESERR
jgi:diadenylate cyclase